MIDSPLPRYLWSGLFWVEEVADVWAKWTRIEQDASEVEVRFFGGGYVADEEIKNVEVLVLAGCGLI